MAGFTDEEVAAAVDRFLLQQVEVPQLKTGARDVLVLRDRVYDLITTALLLRPDSYFYTIYLAKNRLVSLVTKQIADLDSITAAGPNTTRSAKKVESTVALAGAQAALLELSAGLNARNTGVRGSIGPAVDRFRRSVSRFVSTELTKNIVVAGEVVETGPELRESIATTWAGVVERHVQVEQIAENISSALQALQAVKLPESSVRSIVSRIQNRLDEVRSVMEGTEAIAQSRSAALELLTMRTLLTKASTFRNPELVLMPKLRDTELVDFIDSPGEQAAVQGEISGPFNYSPGSVLDLSVNGGTAVLITLPRSSRAELRSVVLSPWVVPTPADEAAFDVDFTTTTTHAISAYANGPAAAADLTAGLSPDVEVSWDASTSQLVFQSTNDGDISHLRLLVDTSIRQGFRDWAFPVSDVPFIENKGSGVSSAEILSVVASSSPLLDASSVTNSLATFTGVRTATGGEEAILWDRIDAASDLVSAGAQATSPSRNFEALGVQVGMALHTTAPSVADYAITSVSGPTLVLEPAAPVGALTYYIGPDYRSVPDEARVQVTSGGARDNTGLYRVAVGGGQVGRIVVDRNLQAPDTVGVAVFQEFIQLEARGTTTSSGLGVDASAGATALGLTPTAELPAKLTRIQLTGTGDFIVRGIRTGDIITLTSSGLVEYETEITEVLATSLLIPAVVPFDPAGFRYEIRSHRADQYTALQAGGNVFLASPYVLSFGTLDTLVGRLIRGSRYTGDISGGVEQYRADLQDLLTVLLAYTVPRERMIDNTVQTMREQGLDRALDLLLALEVEELFSMEPDGVSYATWFIRKAATTAREVVPVSKYAHSERIVQEWRTTSFQPNPWMPRSEDT